LDESHDRLLGSVAPDGTSQGSAFRDRRRDRESISSINAFAYHPDMLRNLILALLCLISTARADLNVAAAISLRGPLERILAAAPAQASATYGSSGQLAAQVRGGAPIDVLIAASRDQMQKLVDDQLIDASSVRQIARNRLVLIVPVGREEVRSTADLSKDAVRRIAIGAPATVPAGDFAMQALKNLKLVDATTPKLILAGNVRQVLDYVQRGEVDAGFVYVTDTSDQVRVVETIDESLHLPIEYMAGVTRALKDAQAQDDANESKNLRARAFVDSLLAAPAQDELKKAGFLPADPNAAPIEVDR
jgi:molybdate transport system substrate-binding protein